MKFLNDNFKIISLALNALMLLLILSIKVNTCTISNDMRTTKKVTKNLNEKSITKEDLQKQTQEYLVKEKQLDDKNIQIEDILKDTLK